MVNYIRSQIKAGNKSLQVSSRKLFEDEAYLKPVLEDDALLYSLDDIDDLDDDGVDGYQPREPSTDKRVAELQDELERLQVQFSEYRLAVQKSMEEQLSGEDEKLATAGPSARELGKVEDADSDYFSSYSFNGTSARELCCLIRIHLTHPFLLQPYTRPCLKTRYAPMPIAISSMRTNTSSRIRWSSM